MQVAFYAPLKPIDHPVPSGDRLIARMLCEALRTAGMNVDIAARLRSRVADGNVLKQTRLSELGTKLAARLLRQYQSGFRPKPDVWFTYHLYYKAPDWIGPIVADALDIPYVVAEASFAPKRANGPWGQSHLAVETALKQADAVFSLNRVDMECLKQVCHPDRLHFLPPFTCVAAWTVGQRNAINPECVRLVTTAMMREGDKLKSYTLLAEALGRLQRKGVHNWHLTVIGDGPARQNVEDLFEEHGLGEHTVSLVGLKTPEQTNDILANSDLFVWPAINEAFGMALLEAQSAGLPVLAGDAGGVSGIVSSGVTGWLVPVGYVDAFSNRLGECLKADIAVLRDMGAAGASKATQHHTVEAAANLLSVTINNILLDRGALPNGQGQA
ncbi:glycosyltransferase family 4 protein [Thalassospira sp. HF15]|uniref:glycosyltransferase family 4 protein n=1 Tax=Thalassospira sp. HF15 TaxID=2722755 RepID=UPI0014321947|nr:glycosyltransferase family 4 protein [Thalassospira sp. HF15]NIY74538.1 glycosyltransferase family 4 protein [Thalassospira sp. HF15]